MEEEFHQAEGFEHHCQAIQRSPKALAGNGAGEMGNIIITAHNIGLGQGKRGVALLGYVSKQAARQGDMDGTAALNTAKTLFRDGLGVRSLLHHPVPKEDLIAKIKASLHEEEGMELVNVNDTSLFFKDHLEARLPVEGGEAIGKTQLDENSMNFRQGGADGSGLVVAKVKARIGGGCAFPSLTPVGLKVRGRDRQRHGRGEVWGLVEGRDKLLGKFIHLQRTDKGTCQDVVGSSIVRKVLNSSRSIPSGTKAP